MRTTKSKKPITVASVCVAAVACAVGAYRFVYLHSGLPMSVMLGSASTRRASSTNPRSTAR